MNFILMPIGGKDLQMTVSPTYMDLAQLHELKEEQLNVRRGDCSEESTDLYEGVACLVQSLHNLSHSVGKRRLVITQCIQFQAKGCLRSRREKGNLLGWG